jgi:hypothetical protein
MAPSGMIHFIGLSFLAMILPLERRRVRNAEYSYGKTIIARVRENIAESANLVVTHFGCFAEYLCQRP